jgi:hypothetical protein
MWGIHTTWVDGQSHLYLAIKFLRHSYTVMDPYLCESNSSWTVTCRTLEETLVTGRTEVWRYDPRSGSKAKVLDVPYGVTAQSISEDGEELVQARSIETIKRYYGYYGQSLPPETWLETDCRVDFVGLKEGTGGNFGTVISSRPQPPSPCYHRVGEFDEPVAKIANVGSISP